MSYAEPTAYSLSRFMESPASAPVVLSAPQSFVTPGQQCLVDRNALMLDAMNQAIREAEERGQLVPSSSIWKARRFLQLLPAEMPDTGSYVSEEESVCFDWDEDTLCQLTVMVQKSGRIAFAAYFAGDRLNGVATFSGMDIPAELSSAIARWIRGGGAS